MLKNKPKDKGRKVVLHGLLQTERRKVRINQLKINLWSPLSQLHHTPDLSVHEQQKKHTEDGNQLEEGKTFYCATWKKRQHQKEIVFFYPQSKETKEFIGKYATQYPETRF